jgi:uncharacterized protein
MPCQVAPVPFCMILKQQIRFIILLLLLLGAPAAFGQQENRVALLIGNAAYPDSESALKDPIPDANALGDELRLRGFDVEVGRNLNKEQMQRALERFYAKIKPGATAFFFFSGFGIQSDRQNYLIPSAAQIWAEADIPVDGYNLETIIGEMNGRGARVKIVLLDAARKNPYERRFRKDYAGLAPLASPKGTLAFTSALPGSVVRDDAAPSFVGDLLKEMAGSDDVLEDVFRRTRMDVLRRTQNRNVPWFSSSLDEDFSLKLPTVESSSRQDSVTDCDRLAAHPSDAQRPSVVAGVFEGEIDVVAALRACNQAMREHPDVARFVFDAGRIAHAQGDYTEALRLFEKASGMGSRIAVTDTGLIYLRGQSVSKNYPRARELFEEAEDKGDLLATALIGHLYQNGEGVVQDYGRAAQLYQKAADAGEPTAINNLGVLYQMGLGVSKDYARARQLFQKAAAADNPEAANNLGSLYFNGWGCPQDYAKAREFYDRAATRGNAVAMTNLARMYGEGLGGTKDDAKARALYGKAADAGNVAAMDHLAVYYQNGRGGPQDYAKARAWFEKAAAAGNVAAMNDLGVLYGKGLGVSQDYGQARNWYEQAAAAGNTIAMVNLGSLYLFGWGVAQDYGQTRQWFEKAAAAGNAGAMNGLGAMYEKGLDVPKDSRQAHKWYAMGAERGSDDAKKNLDRLEKTK